MTTLSIQSDDLYERVKQYEGILTIPAPYVTINVGTFDAAAGKFTGLTTKVTYDPEPIEHGPNQQPTSPAPRYVGAEYVSVTIDAHWRRTTTVTPAPLVAVAPVLLQFTVANGSTPWSVTVNGFTTSAAAGESTLTVNAWDRPFAEWSIQAGTTAHGDRLHIQRKASIPAFGGFTIPVLPVSVVYAPPADSLGKSTATYGTTDTVGTTISYDFSTDSSQTVEPAFADGTAFRAFLTVASTALGIAGIAITDQAAADALSTDTAVSGGAAAEKLSGEGLSSGSKDLSSIASLLPSESDTEQEGTTVDSASSFTLTSTQAAISGTSVAGGGPGDGDNIIFYKNMRVVWAYNDGEFLLCPVGWTFVTVTAAKLQSDLAQVGISSEDQQFLLSLDPFVVGGRYAALPSGRYTVPEGAAASIEYGGGTTFVQTYTVTRDTKTTTTDKSYTTDTSTWNPGAFLQMFGLGTETSKVTTTLTNAVGTDVSDTVTLSANLVSGHGDYFVVTIWYDNLFGTWAFQEAHPTDLPIVSGEGAQSGEVVRLEAGGKVHVTVADGNGNFHFRAPNIAAGSAQLFVNNKAPSTVQVGHPVKKGAAGQPGGTPGKGPAAV